jgi:hypothetical protein
MSIQGLQMVSANAEAAILIFCRRVAIQAHTNSAPEHDIKNAKSQRHRVPPAGSIERDGSNSEAEFFQNSR